MPTDVELARKVSLALVSEVVAIAAMVERIGSPAGDRSALELALHRIDALTTELSELNIGVPVMIPVERTDHVSEDEVVTPQPTMMPDEQTLAAAIAADTGSGTVGRVLCTIGSASPGATPGTFVISPFVPVDLVNFAVGQRLVSQDAASQDAARPPVFDAGFVVVTLVNAWNGAFTVDAQGSGWSPIGGRELVIRP